MLRLNLTLAAIAWVTGAGSVQSAEIRASVRDAGGAPVADAVVVASPVDGAVRPKPPASPEEVDQIDHQFAPRVKPVFLGTAVRFPNRDNVRHHVYSFSPAKQFELPLYAGTPSAPVVFDVPGVVVLGCNIHDWMIGYIYVSESPFFAKTDANGTARLADLPAGRFAVRVWHPQLDGTEQATRRVLDAGTPAVEAAWEIRLRPDIRIRRAPTSGSQRRY